jgi:chitinase
MTLDMRIKSICLLFLFDLLLQPAHAQGTVPTFEHSAGQSSYTLAGLDPVQGRATTIPTVLVPIALSFDAKHLAGKPFVMDAASDVSPVLRSPIFSKFAFAAGNTTQYADAMLRSTFPQSRWMAHAARKTQDKTDQDHCSRRLRLHPYLEMQRGSFAVVDIEFLQRELFKQLPKQDGKLVVDVTHNTTYYTEGDATLCCSWGTHGIDSATGNQRHQQV